MRAGARNKVRNVKRAAAYKRTLKNFRKVVKTDSAEATKMLPMLYKALDKAAKGKTIKKGKASRLRSRAAQLMTRASKASS